MATKRAKTLTDADIDRLLRAVEHSPNRESHRLKIVLSVFAGLRVSEIAKLEINAMVSGDGRISPTISIFSHVGKMGKERSIPMHPKIRTALQEFRKRHPNERFICLGERTDYVSTTALCTWFFSLYKKVGLVGCSSHSGRRTFITNLAKRANNFGNSLRDVQHLAGHSRLDTTEAYIDQSEHLNDLICSLGAREYDTSNQRRNAGTRKASQDTRQLIRMGAQV